jgi:hypothetical protein
MALVVAHPSYRERTVLSEPVRAALAADLTDATNPDAGLRQVRDGR